MISSLCTEKMLSYISPLIKMLWKKAPDLSQATDLVKTVEEAIIIERENDATSFKQIFEIGQKYCIAFERYNHNSSYNFSSN